MKFQVVSVTTWYVVFVPFLNLVQSFNVLQIINIVMFLFPFSPTPIFNEIGRMWRFYLSSSLRTSNWVNHLGVIMSCSNSSDWNKAFRCFEMLKFVVKTSLISSLHPVIYLDSSKHLNLSQPPSLYFHSIWRLYFSIHQTCSIQRD